MKSDRRTFVSALAVALPMGMASSCAKANDIGWPGPDTPAGQLPKLPIGMNLAAVANWEPSFPFRNLMWGAGQWMTRNEFGGGPWDTQQIQFFSFDADGYPLEVPLNTPASKGIPQQVFVVLPSVLKPGRYILLYDGEGAFDGQHGTRVVSQSPGRVVLQMTHDSEKIAEALVIRKSKRGNHVHNIRIIAEGDDPRTLADNPFRPEFLEFCKPFHALRFMDWGAVNNSLESQWQSRRRPTFYTMMGQSGDPEGLYGPALPPHQMMYSGGVAYEVMIKLANKLQIDPWICIPHRASDDYIRQCSALFRDGLDPSRRVYVEYSNEVWNWQFIQAQWVLRSELAGTLVEGRGGVAWAVKAGVREGGNQPERMAAMFSRTFSLWRDEWPDSRRRQTTMVCAVQSGWPESAIQTINWCKRYGIIDAVAGAAYFAPADDVYERWEKRGAQLTADEVVAAVRKTVTAQGTKDSPMFRLARHAADLGLDFLNYEGGQHILPKGQLEAPYMPALAAAQVHPDMYKLYLDTIEQQRHLGSKLFCAYNSVTKQGTRWGSWGAKDRYSTPNSAAPKMMALLDCNVER